MPEIIRWTSGNARSGVLQIALATFLLIFAEVAIVILGTIGRATEKPNCTLCHKQSLILSL
jgi:hypothetical protein